MERAGKAFAVLSGRRSRRFLCSAAVVAWTFVCWISAPSLNSLAQEAAAPSERPHLKAGPQQRIGPKQIVVKLEFSSEGRSVKQVRAEIVVGSGSWRYRRARAASGAAVSISAREQQGSPEGQSKMVVLFVTISSRKQEIPSGTVAELVFDWAPDRRGDSSGPKTGDQVDLKIRKVEAESADESRKTPKPFEPPTAEPPANPVPTCFFFTH